MSDKLYILVFVLCFLLGGFLGSVRERNILRAERKGVEEVKIAALSLSDSATKVTNTYINREEIYENLCRAYEARIKELEGEKLFKKGAKP